MRVEVRNRSEVYRSYRSERVRSLFNVADRRGSEFDLDVDLPTDTPDWRIGAVVGPSGSGKSSIGRELKASGWVLWQDLEWDHRPIIDVIGEGHDFDDTTGALAAVGLGDVPAWLRPYRLLSNGERFRAELARLVVEAPKGGVVVDEFTSVVDRQIACVGAMAFSKAWRRTGGQVIVLSCHHDMLEWLQPDWVVDTGTGESYTKEHLQPQTKDRTGDLRRLVAVLEV